MSKKAGLLAIAHFLAKPTATIPIAWIHGTTQRSPFDLWSTNLALLAAVYSHREETGLVIGELMFNVARQARIGHPINASDIDNAINDTSTLLEKLAKA